jgi:chemotaxis protein methyltransferase CheR
MENKKRVLSKTDFDVFCKYIESHTGVYIDESRQSSFTSSLNTRMNTLGIKDYGEYYAFLTTHALGKKEFGDLLCLILIKETFFFRDDRQLRVLTTNILPELRERKKGKEIKIWSAGCATGEEPYSIAIAITENFPPGSINFSLYATDISPEALTLAKKGVYNKNSMRAIDKVTTSKYFIQKEGRYYLNDHIKQLVRFDTANLVRPCSPQDGNSFDIIFCKNVIIYFRSEVVKKVIRRFYDMLSPGGYLLVGHSESLWQISNEFTLEEISGVFLYRKNGSTIGTPSSKRLPLEEKHIGVTSKLLSLQAGSDIRFLQYQKASIYTTPAVIGGKTTDKPIPKTVNDRHIHLRGKKDFQREGDTTRIKIRIKSLLKRGFQFTEDGYEALSEEVHMLLESDSENMDAHLLLVKMFSDTGQYDKALKKCTDALRVDDLCAETYELMGSIYYKIGEKEKAITSFRKAIYLDDRLLISHYYIGNLYKDSYLVEQAIKEYKNVIRIIEADQVCDEWLVEDVFTVKQLKEVCIRNIEILTSKLNLTP